MSSRREFILALGCAAAAWPLATRAQKADRVRRIGVLMPYAASDPEAKARNAAFLQGLQELGWSVGRDVQIEYRWIAGDADRTRKFAAELVALAPDVIVATATPPLTALQQATRTIPIVFVNVADPVGTGAVESLARPGGNATGFTVFEFAITAKWLELLKQMAPNVTRAVIIREAANPGAVGQMAAMLSVAPSLGLELKPVGGRDASEIDRAVSTFAREPNSGLIVTAVPLTVAHSDLIVSLAARHRLPAVYPFRLFVVGGGLIAYGPNSVDPYRRAAGYVDRILKGEKPADLPVQAPTKYELAINLKTAKALGLTVPTALLATADEVIE